MQVVTQSENDEIGDAVPVYLLSNLVSYEYARVYVSGRRCLVKGRSRRKVEAGASGGFVCKEGATGPQSDASKRECCKPRAMSERATRHARL